MNEHTPGPLEVLEHSTTGVKDQLWIVCGDGGPRIATLNLSEDRPAQRANADLFAAAPDMFNACVAALSQLTEDRAEYLESDILQLKEAIAKAKGGP